MIAFLKTPFHIRKFLSSVYSQQIARKVGPNMCERTGRRKVLFKTEAEAQREVGLYIDIKSHIPTIYQIY